LANGNIKKVEDMRTEDFLNSVENSDLHRIDPSTVVRIEPVTDSTVKGNIKITLSYGDQRNHQVSGILIIIIFFIDKEVGVVVFVVIVIIIVVTVVVL